MVGPSGAASAGARFILLIRTTAMVLAADINTMARVRGIKSMRSSNASTSGQFSFP
jgi:hypothetical protein